MRIAVFGAGAVGGYFGARLAELGEDVAFVARGEHLRAIREHGLAVSSPQGDFIVHPAMAVDRPTDIGSVDVVLLAVKAWQVPEAARAMAPLLERGTFVVPLQNGVDAPGQLTAVLGAERVLGGLCRILAYVVEPGHIKHVGGEPYIAFGELDRRPSKRSEGLRTIFSRARGLTVEIPADIHTALWTKFLFIAAASGVGAVTRASFGVLRSQPETRKMLKQALEEVQALATARSVRLSADVVEQTIEMIDQLPANGTTSMHRDIVAGRPSELFTQSGTVVRLGNQMGVPVPLHTFIYSSLLLLELRARGELHFNDQ